MKNSIKKNYIFNVAYQVFAMLVPIITTPYISRVLGAEGIGIYSYTYSIVRYFWLLSALGTSTFGTRNIGIYQDNKEERTRCFWNIMALKIILSTIFGVIYIFYIITFSENKLIAILQGINLLAVMFDITWLYQGVEKFDSVAIKNFFVKLINVLFIFIFIKGKDDLPIYVFGLAFFILLGNLSMWINVKKYIGKVEIKKLEPFKDLKLVTVLFIPSVATQIFSVLDKSMIGWITKNSLENGYYEQAVKIVDMALVIITTLGTVMIPRISREFKQGNKDEVKRYLTKSFKFTILLVIPMMLGIVAISNKFVPVFFGSEYTKSIVLLNILSLLFLFMGLNSVTGSQYLISTNQQEKHTRFLLIGGTVNVILNYIFIQKFEAIGAAIGSVIGEATITFLELRYLYKSKQYNIFEIINTTKIYMIAGLIMFGVLWIFNRHINSIIGILISIIIGIAVYFTTLVLFKEELVVNEIEKIKKL